MRKLITKGLCLILAITFICFGGLVLAEENKQVKAYGATFEFVSNVKTVDLGYGITHIKDVAKSTKIENGELQPQSINVLEIPSDEEVKIVNWTFSNSAGWTTQTVRAMANDFENKNPGWVVIAAINGDFFDIGGDNKILPYQTGGVTVSKGETYRPFTNAQTIGFKNDGSSYPLVAGKNFEVSGHYLNIFNEFDEVIYEQEVKYFNETPLDGEIAIWYSYKDSNGLIVKMNLPKENSFYVKSPVRVLPMSTTDVYAKGRVNAINQEVEMYYGHFGIQTNNEEVQALLKEGTMIRVQQNVIGDYAECTDITGGGVTLVKNGEAVDNTSNTDTHPRTCVGIKDDGTIVFMTVDGRQASQNMYGMAYNELSATMLYYGCNEAYNLDGGGSTTFLTRNQFGDFDIQNSPSDGGERHDSNSLLVVVPEIQFQVNGVSDNQVIIDYHDPIDRDIKVENIRVTIDGETKNLTEFPYVWENLNSLTSYKITAKYCITYKNATQEKEIAPILISTGSIRPTVEDYYYFIYQNKMYIKYSVLNPNDIKIYVNLITGKRFDELKNPSSILTYDLSQVDKEKVLISIGYNLGSSHSEYEEDEYKLEEKNIDEIKKTIKLNLNGGKLDVNELTYIPGVGIKNLPIPKKTFSKFIGWQYNGKIIHTIPTNLDENIELIAIYEMGCSKTSAELLITTLSAISLAILVLRKNKD